MHVVLVKIYVKTEFIQPFIEATLENARNSRLEPGILRFDFLQESDDPSRFILEEIYKTPEDQLKHRETAHYKNWRAAVENWMAEPRQGIKHQMLSPEQISQ